MRQVTVSVPTPGGFNAYQWQTKWQPWGGYIPIQTSPTPTSSSPYQYEKDLSQRTWLIHFIIGFASAIIGTTFGIVALATPATAKPLIAWIVISGAATGIGFINSSYILCRGSVFDRKNLIMGASGLILSIGTAIGLFSAILKYSGPTS